MPEPSAPQTLFIGLLLTIMVAFATMALVWMVRVVRRRGGRVSIQGLGLPDVMVSFFLCGFLGLATLLAEAKTGEDGSARVLTTEQVVPNIVFFITFVGLLIGFLIVRRISPVELFGLRRLAPSRAFLSGVGIIATLFPVLLLVGVIVQQFLQGGAKEQEIVTLYRDVAKSGDTQNLALLLFVAVFFQPIVEEIIFRGYFYAVFKSWAGGLASAIATATLFATIHTTVVAFPALLILALALTLAYEWSGSLLVPISMHMAFNGVQLTLLTIGSRVAST
jgi:membrane protease YdiL (CAAX protease family)